MKTKVWQGDATAQLHPLVEKYTVSDDVWLDQILLGWDIQASMAHAKMLGHCKLIPHSEAHALVQALTQLRAEWASDTFMIQSDQEDGHSAIEHYLVTKLGDVGKKIHTGRSRNDQSLVMIRLYMKDSLCDTAQKLNKVVEALEAKAITCNGIPMPGYTHTQKAMPTTVSDWLLSYHAALVDILPLLKGVESYIDQNPLGSAAGYGVNLPIDREFTTKELQFAKTQLNSLYCGLSRGLFEQSVVQIYSLIMTTIGKFASDMVLFTTEEFNFFSLPVNFTTGSSIMPHKRNYDVFEIMRAHARMYSAHNLEIASVASGLGSGYHRDYQLLKKSLYSATSIVHETLDVLEVVAKEMVANTSSLEAAMSSNMSSVNAVNRLVEQGVPFRDAYQEIKKKYKY